MSLPVDTLIRGYTREEAFEVALTALEAAGVPARSWRPGGVMRGTVGVLTTLGSICSQVVAEGIKANFIDDASGGWLTLLVQKVYGFERIPSTFAAGQLTLTNQGGGVFTWGADELVAVSSTSGKRYRLTAAGNLAAFATITVDISAVESGAASSAPPGTIDKLETPLARVVVGNLQAVIGTDEESEISVRARALAKPGTRSANGPRSAYEFAALSARLPGDVPTSINRCVVLPGLGDGTVTVVVASPSGTPTAPELLAVRDSIEDLARTDTDTVFVIGAVEVTYSRTITIWRRGGNDETVRANALNALSDLQATYPIGGIKKTAGESGYLWADGIESAVIASSPGVIFDVDQDAGDIVLAFNEVPILAATLLVRVAP